MRPTDLGDGQARLGRAVARLADARIETEIAHELLRRGKPVDFADGCDQRQCRSEIHSRNCHQASDVIPTRRGAGACCIGLLQLLAQQIEHSQIGLEGVALVDGRDTRWSQLRPFLPNRSAPGTP